MSVIKQDDFTKVLQFYNKLKHVYRDREMKILDLYEKVTGNMWDAQDRQALVDQKRPVLEYPLVEAMRNAYVGTERLSRMKMRATPDTGGSVKTARLLTSAMTWNQNRTWYDWHKSKQFLHTIIGGIGWGHGYWDFKLKRWIFESYDALRVRWDVRTQKATFEDCRYLEDTQFLTAEEIFNLGENRETAKEIKYRFRFMEPRAEGNIFYNKLDAGMGWMDYAYEDDYVDSSNGRYRCIEHHEKRDVSKTWLVDSSDRVVDATGRVDEEVDAFLDANPDFGRFDIPETEYWITTICPAIKMIVQNQKYELKDPLSFALIPQVAYDVKPYIKDSDSVFKNPVKINVSFNKRKSVELEYSIKSVGGEWIAESGAIDGKEEQWNTRANRVLRIYNSGFQKPTREAPGQVPAALFQYTQDELTLFDIVGGVGANFRGFKESANETGKLAQLKIRQTSNMMQHIFDNAVLSQYLDAQNCIQHIQQYMTDEQLISLDDELITMNEDTIDGVRNVLNDGGKYNVEIDQTRPSSTARQMAFQEVVQSVQTMPMLANFLRVDLLWLDSDLPHRQEQAEFARKMYKSMGIDLTSTDDIDPTKTSNLFSINSAGGTPGGEGSFKMVPGAGAAAAAT